ncbi:MAG: hypothetical protein COT71_03725 [Candidatus Andersenbacteria bacterium CG10_big_fil_rev_8_21_14_0_10_54_11]|uniref:Uncharacterized protein n=1 Tax=Candidatus Andersenbacteria bacterium CG10_big_fil_rev_8_21_14_0_10_54_11 TaxID=1974485 RepID=A0A2M6WYK5_9BACT|nr:MAG: hypothetical protein COT71_03725 [Candidatus Andersenbacteria bacterium CG10_big_fil_rev_8_21_14_0_10_54_11]
MSSLTIRPEITAFAAEVSRPPVPVPEEELIHVSSATRRIAFAYERFRNTLEPDEEEILRRGAIIRILERRMFEDRPPEVIATTILQELIRGHYIEPCPAVLAVHIGTTLQKIRQVYAALPKSQSVWFLHLGAVAIDHELFPPTRQEMLVHLMYHDVYRRTAWADTSVREADRPTQIYLGCHRALYAAENSELAYHYFIHQHPVWLQPELSAGNLDELVKSIPPFHRQMEAALSHPLRDRITRLLRPAAMPYIVLRDLLQTEGEKPLQSAPALAEGVREAYNRRVRKTRGRMNKRAWHSILFLFLTKTVLAIFVEAPYEQLVLGKVHYGALATNITFHPLLLFILATAARVPGQKNKERIVEQVSKIITGEGELPTIAITTPRRYGAATWTAFALFYALLFMGIFWTMFSVLDRLHFSLLAMFFFVVFLGLVSFLATRIRRSVDYLRVIPKGETAASAFISFLALPVLEFGRALAQNIRQINVLLFFMDRVLEAPFKLLIDVTEEWFEFVRDRREEIVK